MNLRLDYHHHHTTAFGVIAILPNLTRESQMNSSHKLNKSKFEIILIKQIQNLKIIL